MKSNREFKYRELFEKINEAQENATRPKRQKKARTTKQASDEAAAQPARSLDNDKPDYNKVLQGL